jgi:peptidoglycan/LPS O-acetylase OafA/YrhL
VSEQGSGGRWGFGHVPALDGLRGLAVAGVLAYHLGHLKGGYLGVDLFFVLSGYLITSLLLAERASTGEVGLAAFWGRRFRRLLPALLVLLVGVAAYARWIARPVDVPGIRTDAFAALAYVANWHTILHGSSYWDISLAPSPLQHVWSLAIEEQFYLVWPLAFFLVAKRTTGDLARRIMWIALVGAALSVAAFIGLHHWGASDTRVYEGTDTRAVALLLGVALAGWRRRPTDGQGSPIPLEVAGVAAAALLGGMWLFLDGQSRWVYRGGLPLASALAVVMVAASSDRRSPILGRVLSFSPLRWLGAISYGLYLWHWPVFQALDLKNGHLPLLGDRVLGSHSLLAAKVLVSLAISIASYFLIEKPIRRGGWIRGWIGIPAAAAGMAVAALVILVGTANGVSLPKITAPVAKKAKVHIDHAPNFLVVGDSVAQSIVRPLIDDPARYGVNPINRAYVGCSVVAQGHQVHSFAGTDIAPAACFRNIDTELKGMHADVVFLLIGSRPNDSYGIGGSFVQACDPAFDEAYTASTAAFIRKLGSTGAPVVVGTVAHSGKQAIPIQGSEERIDCVDRDIAAAVKLVPGSHVLDMNDLVCPGSGPCIEELGGDPIRTDGLHYDTGPGGDRVADWTIRHVLQLANVGRPDPVLPKGEKGG